jgi:hypothetical protein
MILIPLSIENVCSPAGSVSPLSHIPSDTPTKSNLYSDIFLATVVRQPALYKFLSYAPHTKFHAHFSSLR